jgi:hypothetical protein
MLSCPVSGVWLGVGPAIVELAGVVWCSMGMFLFS